MAHLNQWEFSNVSQGLTYICIIDTIFIDGADTHGFWNGLINGRSPALHGPISLDPK
ncbi:MAG: hypothetical protein HRU19_19715 [Pseudobacteriovorax sp.]|nr:hypothetical protein [Pseudobacteriovorax sp.]